jgi:heterodisulfide reductase subunit B
MITKKPKREPRIPKDKPRKPSAKSLLIKADKLARAYCHSTGQCEAKGLTPYKCSDRLEWCHIKSRNHKTIRHDPLNFICMCNTCHRYFTENPDMWYHAIEILRPGAWDRLNALVQEGLKPDYSYWIDYYQRQK